MAPSSGSGDSSTVSFFLPSLEPVTSMQLRLCSLVPSGPRMTLTVLSDALRQQCPEAAKNEPVACSLCRVRKSTQADPVTQVLFPRTGHWPRSHTWSWLWRLYLQGARVERVCRGSNVKTWGLSGPSASEGFSREVCA